MSDKPASPARGRKKTAPPAQQPPQEEVVVRLPLTDLHPFPDHPFQVRDDEEMRETIQSVKEYGVIVPAIVRPREEGGYEIVAGHRRKYACEQAGLDTMPVLIRNLDRDAATIIMVDSNLQRENILPSERAKAYKMKLEANIILTQTERLTMNSRPKDPRTARNKNVLIIGGSGSGRRPAPDPAWGTGRLPS